jgi:uncharacterized protein YeaO (DUF488 family)
MGAGAIPVDIHKAFRERIKQKSALKVYTADSTYEGDDRFDVSFQGGHFMFTPAKTLLLDFRLGRIDAAEFKRCYFDQLEASFIQHQYTWDEMLARERIVLVCSCNIDDASCHRHALIEFLKNFGVKYAGTIKKKGDSAHQPPVGRRKK